MSIADQATGHAGRNALVFAALGDPTRLGIITGLSARGPLSTTSLTSATQLSRQAIAKHLRALEDANLVHGKRGGRDKVWELRTERLEDVGAYLAQISTQWDQALGRLRDFVELEQP
jgi:DNA-binding transcriptional ArsR family regulator